MSDMRLYKADSKRHTWLLEFRDHQGYRRKLSTRTRDRGAALAIGHRIEALVLALARMGDVPPDVVAWVQTCHHLIRDKLVAWKILETRTLHAGRRIEAHVETWAESLEEKERDEQYVAMCRTRVLELFALGGIEYVADITAERIRSALLDLRRGGSAAQTCNHYLAKAKQFCAWGVGPGRRLANNPLVGMKGYDDKVLNVDKKRRRRALTVDEQRYLLAHVAGTKQRPAVARWRMSASDRVLLYRLVLSTGLRAEEAGSLTPRSLNLDHDPPTLTVLAGDSKARREEVIGLREELVPVLAKFVEGRDPEESLFPRPHPDHFCAMLQEDLESARAAWLKDAGEGKAGEQERQRRERTSFLLYHDFADRYADFHALRHTFISEIARVTPNPKITQVLARHRAINTTMKYYTHVLQEEQATALERLPSLEPPQSPAANSAAQGA